MGKVARKLKREIRELKEENSRLQMTLYGLQVINRGLEAESIKEKFEKTGHYMGIDIYEDPSMPKDEVRLVNIGVNNGKDKYTDN